MSKQTEALRLAREALQYVYEGANNQGPHTGISWRCASNKIEPVIAAIDEALADNALDRMAENARELGLDYEPPCKTGSQCTSKCEQCKYKYECDKAEQPTVKQSLTVEQPAQQQEPVAWITQGGKGWLRWHNKNDDHLNKTSVPLYKHPKRKPLSDAEIALISAECSLRTPSDIYFARAIEAAHGIKENT